MCRNSQRGDYARPMSAKRVGHFKIAPDNVRVRIRRSSTGRSNIGHDASSRTHPDSSGTAVEEAVAALPLPYS